MGIAVISALLAALLSQTVFSHLSVNNDESVYLLQARAIAAGHLFPSAPDPAGSFTPWLGVIHGHHYVLKYVPVVAAFVALSLVITGGYVVALMLSSAALVGATYLLTREATGNRVTAAIAAALLSLSPVVLVQSALILPYVPFLVLAELALWGLFAAHRRGGNRPLVVAGLCGGLAFAARPFDALLFLIPALGLVFLGRRRLRLRSLGVTLAATSLPAAGLLWYDYLATGSPLRLPFSLFQSGDTLGFGVHRIYPGERARHFGPRQGWDGLARHLSLLGGGWAFGGVLLLALAMYGVTRKPSRATAAILAGGLSLTVGYLFFWGIWNAGILWGAVKYLGPYYLMPLLVPACILAATGLQALAQTSRSRAGAACALATAVSAVTLAPALTADSGLTAANQQLSRAVTAVGKSLVFVDTYPNYLQHPTSVISNSYPVGQKTVYALERGYDDFAVLKAFPHRSLYRLRLLGEYGKHPHSGFGARLQRLQLVSGRTLSLQLTARLPGTGTGARLYVRSGSRQASFDLAELSVNRIRLNLTAGAGNKSGDADAKTLSALDPGRKGSVSISLLERGSNHKERVIDRIQLPLGLASDGQLSSLVPVGDPTALGPAKSPGLTLG